MKTLIQEALKLLYVWMPTSQAVIAYRGYTPRLCSDLALK